MKLLGRRMVAVESAIQKKNQIDEGVFLATKIDTLRRTLADLETQHKSFIANIKVEAKTQIDSLAEQIAKGKRELMELSEKRKKLQEPLTLAWTEVEQAKKEIEDKKVLAYKVNEILKSKETRIEDKLNKATTSLNRIKIRESELERAYAIAESNREKTTLILSQQVNEKAKQEKDFAERTKKLKDGEDTLNATSENLEFMEKALKDREKGLDDRERFINDKYATLLRTEERLKNDKRPKR